MSRRPPCAGRRRLVALVAPLAFLALAAGCGGSSGASTDPLPSTSDAGAPPDLAQFLQLAPSDPERVPEHGERLDRRQELAVGRSCRPLGVHRDVREPGHDDDARGAVAG